MIQMDMEPLFHGAAYEPARDERRLAGQILRVYDAMKDGQWRTTAQIAKITGDPENSVSAQYRNLRKRIHGNHTVERRHIRNGLFEYRLVK